MEIKVLGRLLKSFLRNNDYEKVPVTINTEAIRGVNSYQTTYGQNVDVSVTADHVYQDRYGDVYGVSGTAPDQEFLNRNDWTELHKNNE